MDWLAWLSKTNLDPSLVQEYAFVFVDNELGEDDIAYFSHDFLQSMGVSVAKHRLEILKVASKEKCHRSKPVLWMMSAGTQLKNFLIKRIRAVVRRNKSPALSVVPKRNHSMRWKLAMLQRNQRFWPRNENPMIISAPRKLILKSTTPVNSGSSTSSTWPESEVIEPGDATANPRDSSSSSKMMQSTEVEYWSGSCEEVKWDSMFQDLKPT